MIAKDHGMEIELATKRLLEYADDHGKGAFSRDVRRETLIIMAQLDQLEQAYREEMAAALEEAKRNIDLLRQSWLADIEARRPWNRFKRLFRKAK
jgi:hypothetical protein